MMWSPATTSTRKTKDQQLRLRTGEAKSISMA